MNAFELMRPFREMGELLPTLQARSYEQQSKLLDLSDRVAQLEITIRGVASVLNAKDIPYTPSVLTRGPGRPRKEKPVRRLKPAVPALVWPAPKRAKKKAKR